MATAQETLDQHIEDIAGLKADVSWLKNHQRKTDKVVDGVETKVNHNQKLLHGFFIAGGIVLAVFTALSPFLMPIIKEAIK